MVLEKCVVWGLQQQIAVLFFHLCYSKSVLRAPVSPLTCEQLLSGTRIQWDFCCSEFVGVFFCFSVMGGVSWLTSHRMVSWCSHDQVKEINFSAPKPLLVPACCVPFFSCVLSSCVTLFRPRCSWASMSFNSNLITPNALWSLLALSLCDSAAVSWELLSFIPLLLSGGFNDTLQSDTAPSLY